MRVHRVFVERAFAAGEQFELPEDAAHHIGTVLRAKTGQPLELFNEGVEAQAEVIEANRKRVLVQVTAVAERNTDSPLAIHLAIGISRGERMDYVLQKSTELGVASITPMFTERCEVKLSGERLEKKVEQWRKIVIGACEQSGRTRLPHINAPQTLAQVLQSDQSAQRFVLHHRSDGKLSTEPPASVLLLIGPEGGLSEAEIAQAQASNARALTLGPRILRTETAPLVAMSILQYQWGDLA